MVATSRTARGFVVTILNYDKYQDIGNYEGNGEEGTGATAETARTQLYIINKKRRKEKERKEIYKEKISTKGKSKEKLGSFANVLLTEEEQAKLKKQFNGTFEDKIENLSVYLASKGDKSRVPLRDPLVLGPQG